MTCWLYDTEKHADRLDAEVSRAKGWPADGTNNWSNPRHIEQGECAGMWYVAAPPVEIREEMRTECPPDVEVEYSSDWYPTDELG